MTKFGGCVFRRGLYFFACTIRVCLPVILVERELTLAALLLLAKIGQISDVFVKSCDTRERSKGDAPWLNPLQALPLPKPPREDLSMDFITGIPQSVHGNNAILTFVDRLTKYAHFVNLCRVMI